MIAKLVSKQEEMGDEVTGEEVKSQRGGQAKNQRVKVREMGETKTKETQNKLNYICKIYFVLG